MQKNIVEEESVNVCRENLIIKENSSLSSHGLKPRGFSRSLLYKNRKQKKERVYSIIEIGSFFCVITIHFLENILRQKELRGTCGFFMGMVKDNHQTMIVDVWLNLKKFFWSV